MGKKKKKQTKTANSKVKEISHHFSQVDWCPASLQRATSEAKTILLSLPQILLLNMMLYGLLYLSPWPAQVSCPSCVPSQKEKVLTLLKHYSATAKTLLCYQGCFSHKSKTRHHPGCYEVNTIPARPSGRWKLSVENWFAKFSWKAD